MTERFSPDIEARLRHLPPRKRRELGFITALILREFKETKARAAQKQPRNIRLLRGKIVKIILFGSYSRGGWVEDRKSGYRSDYDLLIITSNEEAASPEAWRHTEGILLAEELGTKRISAPVEIITHSYHEINCQLRVGRPFFMDILHDGIELYAAPGSGYKLANAANMTEAEQYKEAQKYFEEQYIASLSALTGAGSYLEKAQNTVSGDHKAKITDRFLRDSAFLAHQATERIYHCLLLTTMFYSPKLHNLRKLRSVTNAVVPGLAEVWPQNKRAYKRCFELLRRAYVEARYSRHYKITELELQWLFGRIELLQSRVKQICEAFLQNMR